MSVKWNPVPTLREFIDEAIRQGASYHAAADIHGPRGSARVNALYKTEGNITKVVVLPEIDLDSTLLMALVVQFKRALNMSGFDHCVLELPGYKPTSDEET